MRRVVTLVVGLLAVAGCAADDPDPPSGARWVTTRQGCGVWDPQPRQGEVVDWTGACMGGFTEGHGTLTWRSPSPLTGTASAAPVVTQTYEGDMRHGKDEGDGVLEDVDPRTGKGRYVMTGHFADDQPDGRVAVAGADGFRFEGSYRQGRRSGPGVARYANGATYDGPFRDGLPEGRGVLTGQASIRFPPGHADTGGAMVSPGSWRYDGAFARGTPEGHGTLVLAGAAASAPPRWTLAGEWVDGCLSDRARQACIGPGRDRAPELAILPLGHRAIAKGWAVRPVLPADAAAARAGGKVTVRCYVSTAGVADQCDAGASTDHRLDLAATTMATAVPWIPAATPDGAPVDDPDASDAITFDAGPRPGD